MKHLVNFKIFENMVDEDPMDDQEDFETSDFDDLEVIIDEEDVEFDSPSLDGYEPESDDEDFSVENDFDDFEEEEDEFMDLEGDDDDGDDDGTDEFEEEDDYINS
jgi:hypothetical protein